MGSFCTCEENSTYEVHPVKRSCKIKILDKINLKITWFAALLHPSISWTRGRVFGQDHEVGIVRNPSVLYLFLSTVDRIKGRELDSLYCALSVWKMAVRFLESIVLNNIRNIHK